MKTEDRPATNSQYLSFQQQQQQQSFNTTRSNVHDEKSGIVVKYASSTI